jgi:hypothetical protein
MEKIDAGEGDSSKCEEAEDEDSLDRLSSLGISVFSNKSS